MVRVMAPKSLEIQAQRCINTKGLVNLDAEKALVAIFVSLQLHVQEHSCIVGYFVFALIWGDNLKKRVGGGNSKREGR